MAALNLRKIEGLTVRLTVTRELRFRVWLATQIFTFGAWILGGRVEIDFPKEA